MARLCLLLTLFLVMLMLGTSDGLHVTKTRLRRSASRDTSSRVIYPDEFNNNPTGIGALLKRIKTSTSTNKSKQQPLFEKPTTLTGSRVELSLSPVNLAHRLIPRTDTGKDTVNYDDVGVVNLTRSVAGGIQVTVIKEDTASETTLRKHDTSQPSCNLDDPSKPKIVAGCGDYYLYPGYNVKLAADSMPCVWRFRYTAPNVIITSRGLTSKDDYDLHIEESNASKSTQHIEDRYGLGGQIPRDLVIELDNNTTSKNIPAEICVPADSHNAQFDKYDLHEGVCCHTAPDTKCGIPNGTINDEDFGRHTFPWEVVLKVTISDKKNDSYCSGTLISDEWVVTTAACILRPKNQYPTTEPVVSVSFEVDNKDDPATYGVKEYILYPTSTEAHDIALVKLDRKSQRTPACLPPYNNDSPNKAWINMKGIVFGWVLPDDGTPYMSTRTQLIINNNDCNQRLGEVLSPHMICTVDRITEEEPCLADGDLLVGTEQYTLIGLSKPRLTCKDDIRQHTSIQHFMPWISRITGIKMRN